MSFPVKLAVRSVHPSSHIEGSVAVIEVIMGSVWTSIETSSGGLTQPLSE